MPVEEFEELEDADPITEAVEEVVDGVVLMKEDVVELVRTTVLLLDVCDTLVKLEEGWVVLSDVKMLVPVVEDATKDGVVGVSCVEVVDGGTGAVNVGTTALVVCTNLRQAVPAIAPTKTGAQSPAGIVPKPAKMLPSQLKKYAFLPRSAAYHCKIPSLNVKRESA